MHKLMIKTHRVTGLKYLCKTIKTGAAYDKYKGSGTLWKKHLKKHGTDVSTELLFECEDIEEFKQYAIAKSIELDIVNSPEWANLKLEEGDGGVGPNHGGWKLTEERKRQIAEINRKRFISSETKLKMSESHKGKKGHGPKGRPITEEHRQKLREGQRRRWDRIASQVNVAVTIPS